MKKIPQNSVEDSIIIETLKTLAVISKYSRTIVLLILFSSIIIFVNVWNSNQDSWLRNRIKIHEEQNLWCKYYTSDTLPNSITKGSDEEKEFYIAKKYYIDNKYTPEIVKNTLTELKKAEIETIYVLKIPFVNVNFDINDLGMFAGTVLFFIMFIYYYILMLKSKNIKIVFKIIEKYDLNKDNSNIYLFLALNQVTEIKLEEEKNATDIFKNFIGKIPNFITIMPILIQAYVICHDLSTIKYGNILNSNSTSICVYYSIFILLLIIAITILCLIEKSKIDNFWKPPVPTLPVV